MERVLVVGATGQAGRAAIRKLTVKGATVRALIRNPQSASQFSRSGVETTVGDLTNPESLAAACAGISTIVATANSAVPSRRSDTFDAVERQGYRNLIEAAIGARVRRFIYTSVPETRHSGLSDFFPAKRETERALLKSGIESVILQADIFMDTAFAMMGSAIPLRGAEGATVLRPFQFANRHFSRIHDSIEKKNVARIPGDGTCRHTFICVEDVASFLAAAALGGPPGIYRIGGPEALTFSDVVRIYELVLGKSLRIQKTPAAVFRIMASVLKPFSPAGANLMALNYIACMEETLAGTEAAGIFNVKLTTAEEFLRSRAVLKATV